MAYDKQTWDTNSFVNPTRMNHIENGIKENSDEVGVLKQNIADQQTAINNIPILKHKSMTVALTYGMFEPRVGTNAEHLVNVTLPKTLTRCTWVIEDYQWVRIKDSSGLDATGTHTFEVWYV